MPEQRTGSTQRVSVLYGAGPKTGTLLQRMDIETLADLFAHYPLRFVTYPELTEIGVLSADDTGTPVTVCMEPVRELARRSGRGMQLCIGIFNDGPGKLSATWFHMPYLRETLRPGRRTMLFGKVQPNGSRLHLQQPQLFTREQYKKLLHRPVPQYALSKGISEKTFGALMEQVLSMTPPISGWLPPSLREHYGLLPGDMAVREIHAPRDMENLAVARKRIVFDGFLRFLYTVRRLKETLCKEKSFYTSDARAPLIEFQRCLPFSLTTTQQKVCDDFCRDFTSGTVMNRLVQGDVGSGKTAVATVALFAVCRAGYQGALMAPIEVLAHQYYETLCILFAKAGPSLCLGLLTGSTRMRERRVLLERLKCGEIDLLIRTHALLEETVVFSALALVVTDEQHRFGVLQREKLASKGQLPHILVMSATPIPRTLAVILYGDPDNSVINARLAGHNPIKNAVIEKKDRPKVLPHIKREIAAGHQVYIVCPQVEPNSMTDLENVEEHSTALRKSFHGEITVGALHGRMKEAEKQAVMERFARGEISVLVVATVIEVEVDVPNAAVMMVKSAERFGLVTLYQLRDRIGRGKDQAYCIFVQGKKNKDGTERLSPLQHSSGGFEVTAEDLKHRGPDKLFGTAQNGELTFGLGDIHNDYLVLQLTKEAVDTLARADLILPEVHTKVMLQGAD